MAGSVKIVVSVDGDRAGGAAQIVAKLRAAGVEVLDVLEELDTIVARCNEDQLTEIGSIDGVLGIERARDVGIPPPSSPVQ